MKSFANTKVLSMIIIPSIEMIIVLARELTKQTTEMDLFTN